MDSQEKPSIPESSTKKETEIVGMIILGERDPRQMTQAEFNHSPDLLFHGSAKDMQFSPDYDYGDAQNYAKDAVGDGSVTLGMGFYTSRVKGVAENYSKVRQLLVSAENKTPHTISLLPHQAQVLDLRVQSALDKNGSFPHALAVGWQQYFKKYLDQRQPPTDNLAQIFYDWESDYQEYINQIIQTGDINLRHFLQTDQFPGPPWCCLFPHFMTEQGIDGIVYNEGGEGPERECGATYVFYNLKKIGTWESWQKLKV